MPPRAHASTALSSSTTAPRPALDDALHGLHRAGAGAQVQREQLVHRVELVAERVPRDPRSPASKRRRQPVVPSTKPATALASDDERYSTTTAATTPHPTHRRRRRALLGAPGTRRASRRGARPATASRSRCASVRRSRNAADARRNNATTGGPNSRPMVVVPSRRRSIGGASVAPTRSVPAQRHDVRPYTRREPRGRRDDHTRRRAARDCDARPRRSARAPLIARPRTRALPTGGARAGRARRARPALSAPPTSKRREPAPAAVEVAERAVAHREEHEHEPRQHDDRPCVDAHLEALGVELVEQLQVLRRRVDEVFEDRPHDPATAFVREHEHFEDAVARRVGELVLHDLERGPVPTMRARCGKRANASRNGSGPVAASAVTAWPSEWPAEIDASRSRSPSGHAACTRRSRCSRWRPKYARGSNDDRDRPDTAATNHDPVTARTTSERDTASAGRPGCELRRRHPEPGLAQPGLRAVVHGRPRRARAIGETRTADADDRADRERTEPADEPARRARSRREPPVLDDVAQAVAGGHRAADACGEARRAARPSTRAAARVASRTKIGSQVNPSESAGLTAVISVTCRRMPDPCATSSRSTCTTRSSASLNTLRTIRSVTFSPAINAAFTSAFNASGAVLAWTVHRNPHPAFTAPCQLEGLRAAHLADHDPVGPHCEHELHEVPQRDLAGAVERRRPHLVVAAVRDRHRDLADLLAAARAVPGRRGGEERAPRASSCPAPGSPEIATRLRTCITAPRNAAACALNVSRVDEIGRA